MLPKPMRRTAASKRERLPNFLVVIWAACCSLLTTSAWALCVNPPSPLPDLPGLPRWAGASGVDTDLTDPRWGGGPLRTFDTGITNASYRLLADSAELVVSFEVYVNPDSGAFHAVYLGLTQNDPPTQAVLARVELAGTGTTATNIPASRMSHWTWSSGTWSGENVGAKAPWFSVTEGPVSFRDPPDKASVKWAINIKVNLAAANLLTTVPFRIALGAETEAGGTVMEFATPDPGAAATRPGTPILDNPVNWAPVTPLNGGCPNGVVMSSTSISTMHPMGPTYVDATLNAVNTFVAQPSFAGVPGGTAGAAGMNAVFQVANWGSVVGAEDWPVIGTDIGSSAGRFELTCTATATEPCGVDRGSGGHQCLQVAVQNNAGSNVPITKAADFRNMIYQNLSKIEKSASVRFASARERLGANPDIYLYVNTINMPTHGEEKYSLSSKRLESVRQNVERVYLRKPNEQPSPNDMAGGQGKGEPYQEFTDDQLLAQVYPTYQVFAYYDTGRKRTIDGAQYPILHAMFPFGFYLTHEGVHYGFKHSLAGEGGVTLQELSPDFYKVIYAKEDAASEFALKVSVEATEKPLSATQVCPTCVEDAIRNHEARHCHCRVVGRSGLQTGALGAGVLLALLGLIRLRKRSD